MKQDVQETGVPAVEKTPTENKTVVRPPLLQVKNLKKYFPIKKALKKENSVYLKAVDGVSFQVDYGKTVGIVGESGCGKTTMGRTVLRLYDVTDGEILFEGQDIAHLKGESLRKVRPNFQMIFQDPYASLSPRLTVGELIGEAVLYRFDYQGGAELGCRIDSAYDGHEKMRFANALFRAVSA